VARGADPEDTDLFAPRRVSTLQTAVAELSWLLGRGYAESSALALVGNRHRLRKRQRDAVRRSACPDASVIDRHARRLDTAALSGRSVVIDGFNCLITLEAALAGAPLFRGRDGVVRDIASVHGSWRRVETTAAALAGIAEWQRETGLVAATWLLDRPVANSGRLAALIEQHEHAAALHWTTELPFDPDALLMATQDVVATADGTVLDHCTTWTDLVGPVLARVAPHAWIVDLGG